MYITYQAISNANQYQQYYSSPELFTMIYWFCIIVSFSLGLLHCLICFQLYWEAMTMLCTLYSVRPWCFRRIVKVAAHKFLTY